MFNILSLLGGLKGGQMPNLNLFNNNNSQANNATQANSCPNCNLGYNNQNFSQFNAQNAGANKYNNNNPTYTYNPMQQQNAQQATVQAFNSSYPYGEFPVKYTKQGQAEIKEQLQKGRLNDSYGSTLNNQVNTNAFLNNNNTNQFANNTNTVYTANDNNNNNNNNQNQNNNNGNSFNGLDINSLLPLLGGLGGKNNNADLIKNLLPLLSGNGNLNPNDLIKLISPGTKKNDLAPKIQGSIDSFKKVN